MTEPNATDTTVTDLNPLFLQLVSDPFLALSRKLQGITQNLLFNFRRNPVRKSRGLPGLFKESLQALFLNESGHKESGREDQDNIYRFIILD